MNFFRKIIFRILLLLIFISVGVVLARNTIGLWAGKSLIEKTTHFATSIAFLDIQLSQPRVLFREVTLLNPKDTFREPIAAKINRVEMDYDPMTWIQLKPHLNRLVFDLENVSMVRNVNGQINLTLLKSSSGKKNSNQPIQLDELILSLNTLTFIDETRPQSRVYKYALRIQAKSYKNLKSTQDIRKTLYQFIIASLPEQVEKLAVQFIEPSFQKAPGILESAKGILSTFRGQTDTEADSNQAPK